MKKILISGPILSRSGYGEMARFAFRSLKDKNNIDLYLLPTSWGNTGWLFEDNEERKSIDQLVLKTQLYIQSTNNNPSFDISLQISIPNEWKKLAPINIGYTAGIETNMISPAWLEPSQAMDKIIVISEHAKAGFINTVFGNPQGQQFKVTVPIEVVHLPFRELMQEKLDLNLRHDFNFLSICQWSPRKNLEQTINGFLEEFSKEEVGLVLKINTANDSIMDREHTTKRLKILLSNYPDRKCSVTFLHGHLKDEQMYNLFNHPKIKAIVSTTHGEGYGLPLMEAAANGLPVIATDWSGHTDFLYIKKDDEKKRMFGKIDYELKPIAQEHVWQGVLEAGTSWAYPKTSSYKEKLRDCFKDYGRYLSTAKKLSPWIKDNFSEDKLFNKFATLIAGETAQEIAIENLPKISLFASVYRADEYIEQYLDDVTRQTIFKEKCELVLVNPNSPGNEEEIIKKYMEKYPNIVYKKLDHDPGIYDTWNEAIKLCSGEYITNANLDDRKAPFSLEKHAKALFANPDVDLVYADSYIMHEPNKRWEHVSNNTERYNFEDFSLEAMLRGNPPHNNPMWRKKLHESNGWFDQKYKSAGDWDFWLRCAFNGAKYKKINEVLGVYYHNPKGMSTNPEHVSWKREHEKEIFKKYLNIYQERMK
jgi:glycosyltransferase involved in cell wall biosynthesis